MREQNELIAQMGATLRSLHVQRDDPTKDDQYWREFAVASERAQAARLGMEKQFDEALASGHLKEIRHRIVLAGVIREGAVARRVWFAAGLLLGSVLTVLLKG